MRDLRGVFVPIVTPFTDDGMDVSETRLARLVKRLIAGGAEGLVVGTDTGEFSTLAAAERKSLVEIAIRESQGQLPVIVYAGMASTAGTLDLSQHAARHGAVAVVVGSPVALCLSQKEIENYVRSVAQYARITVVVVDPSDAIQRATVERLSGVPELHIARPLGDGDLGTERSTTDEFRWDEVVVTALALFPTVSDRTGLATAMNSHGRARTSKTLFEALDFDLGPPRAPMLPLVGDARAEVAALVG